MSRIHIIFTKPEPGPSLSPSLAVEIGLNESLILLQINYWISKNGHLRDGRVWTWQSVTDLEAQFPYIPRTTIRRVIHRLIKRNFIRATSKYNKRANDKTRWFSLDERGLSTLKSIRFVKAKRGTTLSHFGSDFDETLSHIDPTLSQISPTLPTTSPTSKTYIAGADVSREDDPAEWDEEELDAHFDELFDDVGPEQPFLLPSFPKREKELRPIEITIPSDLHSAMYRLCYRAETEAEQLTLTSGQRGVVASTLGQLRDAGADFSRLDKFEAWWVQNWRSKDKGTNQYQPPRPTQVLEHWNEAMKSGVKPEIDPVADENGYQNIDIHTLMKNYRARP